MECIPKENNSHFLDYSNLALTYHEKHGILLGPQDPIKKSFGLHLKKDIDLYSSCSFTPFVWVIGAKIERFTQFNHLHQWKKQVWSITNCKSSFRWSPQCCFAYITTYDLVLHSIACKFNHIFHFKKLIDDKLFLCIC